MATLFPTALDAFPSGTTLHGLNQDGSVQSSPGTAYHSTLHGDEGDALLAIETKVGITGSLDAASVDYFMSTLAARLDRANTFSIGPQTVKNSTVTQAIIADAANGHSAIGPTAALDTDPLGLGFTAQEFLNVTGTYSGAFGTGNYLGVEGFTTADPSSATGNVWFYGGGFHTKVPDTNSTNGFNIQASWSQADHYGTGTLPAASGSEHFVYNRSSGSINVAKGMICEVTNEGSGHIGTAMALYVYVSQNDVGSITNAYGAYISWGGPNQTNTWGLFIADQAQASPGATNYNLYSQDLTGLSHNYIGGQLGIGQATVDASAKVQIDSTTKGLAPPRGTTTQKNAIGTPLESLIFYDTTLHAPYFWNGSAWTAMTGGATYSADGTTLTLTGTTFSIKAGYLSTIATTGAITDATGTLLVTHGGTGLATLTAHAVQVGAGTSTPAQVGPGSTSGVPLVAKGASADPAFQSTALQLDSYQGIITADSDAAPTNFDWSLSLLHSVTLTASRTITFSNPVTGGRIIILFNSGGTGAFTPVWPATVKWLNGAAPVLTNTSGSVDVVSLLCTGSNTYLGSYAKGYA